MRPPTSNSLWARLLCTIRDRIRPSTSVGCIVSAQRPMLGTVCTWLFSIAPAFARFAVVTGSGDSSALGEKCVVLKGSHDVHVLGSVRRVVVVGFPTHAEESGKPMENRSGRHSRAECGDGVVRPRAGPGCFRTSRWHVGRYFEDAETAHGACRPGM